MRRSSYAACRSRPARVDIVWLLALACLATASGVAVAGPAPRVEKNVAYGNAGGVAQLLDVFEPAAFRGLRPAVVLIHGGGWMYGDKAFYTPLGIHLADEGYVAFAIDYRLAPKFQYPAQVDDAQRAVEWIRAHARQYHVDPERIGALGDSAGGYLVAMLGARDARDHSDAVLSAFRSRVACVVDFYGPTDLTLDPAKSGVTREGVHFLTAFFGKTQAQAPDLYRDGSPIVYVDKNSAPFLIIHGSADGLVPVGQSELLFDALRRVGVEAHLVLLYGFRHGFFNPARPGEAGALVDFFLKSHLTP